MGPCIWGRPDGSASSRVTHRIICGRKAVFVRPLLYLPPLSLSLSSSGDGAASEGFGRASGPLQPGHVLPGPAETVHQRQERPDATPPQINTPQGGEREPPPPPLPPPPLTEPPEESSQPLPDSVRAPSCLSCPERSAAPHSVPHAATAPCWTSSVGLKP